MADSSRFCGDLWLFLAEAVKTDSQNLLGDLPYLFKDDF
jgi:hypothetical protein